MAVYELESTYRIAIADCKDGIFSSTHDGDKVKVKIYRTIEGRIAYGFNMTKEEIIYNPDFSVMGIYEG